MQAFLRSGLMFIALFAALVAVLFGVLVFPWVRSPALSRDQIAQGWSEVETWAGLKTWGNADVSPLVKAEMAISNDLPLYEPRIRSALQGPAIPVEELPEAGQIALRAWEQWDSGGRGLGSDACGDVLEGLPLYTLGRLLLVTESPRGPAEGVARTLRLAAALRTSGNLRVVSIGYNLAEEALDHARSRSIRRPPDQDWIAPEPEEAFAALCRQAVCGYRQTLLAAQTGGIPSLVSGLTEEQAGPAFVRPFQDVGRELATLQAWQVERLKRAEPVRRDLPALQARLSFRPADLPKSPAVRGTAVEPSQYLERWREVTDAWDSFRGSESLAATAVGR